MNWVENLINKLLDNLQEVVFLCGLILISVGIFQFNVIIGLIATGVMLMGLSFLLGGD